MSPLTSHSSHSQTQPSAAFWMLLGFCTLALMPPEVWAQVDAAKTQVTGMMQNILSVVKAGGVAGFTISVILLGYKAIFVEGFRLSDGKGLMIGGVLFGAASAIASMLTNTTTTG